MLRHSSHPSPVPRAWRLAAVPALAITLLILPILSLSSAQAATSCQPGPPQYAAAAPGNRQAIVTFHPPAYSPCSGIDHYTIVTYDSATGQKDPNVPDVTVQPGQSGGEVNALDNYTQYYFLVFDFNSQDYNYSQTSNSATPYQQYTGTVLYGPFTFTSGQSYPVPYTYPDRTTGKLFFNDSGTEYSCTAWVATTGGQNNVITAGHCVNSGGNNGTAGTYYSDFQFVPAYDGDIANSEPYGVFPAKYVTTTAQWVYYSNLHDDFAVLTLNNNASGQQIQPTVGSLGIVFGAARSRYNFISTGYPGNIDNGQANHFCQFNIASQEFNGGGVAQPSSQSDGSEYGAGCDGSRGMSGGPYRNSDGSNIVYTIRSYASSSAPSHKFGPYFGMDAQAAYNYANSQ